MVLVSLHGVGDPADRGLGGLAGRQVGGAPPTPASARARGQLRRRSRAACGRSCRRQRPSTPLLGVGERVHEPAARSSSEELKTIVSRSLWPSRKWPPGTSTRDLGEEGVDGEQRLERVVDRRADRGALERQRLVEVRDHGGTAGRSPASARPAARAARRRPAPARPWPLMQGREGPAAAAAEVGHPRCARAPAAPPRAAGGARSLGSLEVEPQRPRLAQVDVSSWLSFGVADHHPDHPRQAAPARGSRARTAAGPC